ncbi:C40 family peptidase [Streptomyces sp. NPDC088560]|uniref:C40 family peptidase n=1 Tax=Streptomyces sp. NPDC088560 TaxID=3365868 RepID=UPI0038194AC3
MEDEAFAAVSKSPSPPTSLAEVRQQLDALYHKAEVATQNYDAAKEKVQKQSRTITQLSQKTARTKRRLGDLTQQAGAAARAQYRGGLLPSSLQFALSPYPANALDAASSTYQVENGIKKLIDTLSSTEQDLRERSQDAKQQLQKLKKAESKAEDARHDVEKRIATARNWESSLEVSTLQSLARQDQSASNKAKSEWDKSGGLDSASRNASPASKKAVQFALAQIGKPYVWGAQGPDSFDCSGLTSQAWAAAGHPIPRTSQEQWRQLTRVSVAQMQPGDLIIYFSDASHVAMYIGDGTIVQAPRPGRTVSLGSASSMQILGVVRPDA